MEKTLDFNKNQKIGFLVLSAYGNTKEPVASNRIIGLIKNIKFMDIVLVALEFPGQTPSDIKAFADIFIVRNSFFQKFFRKLLNLRKKQINEAKTKENTLTTQKSTKQAIKKFIKTLMHIWYAEGYTFPFVRFTLKSIYAAKKKLKENERLVVFASNGPAAVGLSGVIVKKIFRKKIFLVQDFRDPIARNIYLKDQANKRVLEFIEKMIISSADLVTAVSQGVIESLTIPPKNTYVLYNGFDSKGKAYTKREVIKNSIGYLGSVYSDRLKPLSQFAQAIKGTDYRFFYAGKNTSEVKEIFRMVSAEENLEILGFLSKDEVLNLINQMQILLILKGTQDRGVLTGKLFEYLQAEKPILVIGDSDSEFNEIVKNFGGVYVVSKDSEAIRKTILELARSGHEIKRNLNEVEKFSWNSLAENFTLKLKDLLRIQR